MKSDRRRLVASLLIGAVVGIVPSLAAYSVPYRPVVVLGPASVDVEMIRFEVDRAERPWSIEGFSVQLSSPGWEGPRYSLTLLRTSPSSVEMRFLDRDLDARLTSGDSFVIEQIFSGDATFRLFWFDVPMAAVTWRIDPPQVALTPREWTVGVVEANPARPLEQFWITIGSTTWGPVSPGFHDGFPGYWDFEYFDRDRNLKLSAGDEFAFYNLGPGSYRVEVMWLATAVATTSLWI